MDGLGAITLISAVTCLLLALQWGGHTIPWSSSRIIGLFVGFSCLTIVFGLLQWKLGEKATIPLRILKQRSVLMGCLFIAFLDMTAYTVGLINRKFLQQDSMADYVGVCLLSFFLLPRRTGGFSHDKRCPIHAVSYTANSGNRCFWCHCYQVRLLCRISSSFSSAFKVNAPTIDTGSLYDYRAYHSGHRNRAPYSHWTRHYYSAVGNFPGFSWPWSWIRHAAALHGFTGSSGVGTHHAQMFVSDF